VIAFGRVVLIDANSVYPVLMNRTCGVGSGDYQESKEIGLDVESFSVHQHKLLPFRFAPRVRQATIGRMVYGRMRYGTLDEAFG